MKKSVRKQAPVVLQVTYRNVAQSAMVEERIGEEVEKLARFYPRIMGCRVAVESPNQHHKGGMRYRVRIDLTLPGGELVVGREPNAMGRARRLATVEMTKASESEAGHKELFAAIHDAFRAAGRRLQDYARRQRGDVKRHEAAVE